MGYGAVGVGGSVFWWVGSSRVGSVEVGIGMDLIGSGWVGIGVERGGIRLCRGGLGLVGWDRVGLGVRVGRWMVLIMGGWDVGSGGREWEGLEGWWGSLHGEPIVFYLVASKGILA